MKGLNLIDNVNWHAWTAVGRDTLAAGRSDCLVLTARSSEGVVDAHIYVVRHRNRG